MQTVTVVASFGETAGLKFNFKELLLWGLQRNPSELSKLALKSSIRRPLHKGKRAKRQQDRQRHGLSYER